MAEPNSLQRVSMNHLRNKLPAGAKFLLMGGAMQPSTDPRFPPDYFVSRTVMVDNKPVMEQFIIAPDGKVRPAS